MGVGRKELYIYTQVVCRPTHRGLHTSDRAVRRCQRGVSVAELRNKYKHGHTVHAVRRVLKQITTHSHTNLQHQEQLHTFAWCRLPMKGSGEGPGMPSRLKYWQGRQAKLQRQSLNTVFDTRTRRRKGSEHREKLYQSIGILYRVCLIYRVRNVSDSAQ